MSAKLEFEGVLSRYPKDTTIGIYVTLVTDGYSRFAIERAETSKLNMLLTNASSMRQDIFNYLFEKLDNDSDDSDK
ncbi:14797_t:CDS:1, partial [Dentiscutata heterogama]